MLMLLAQIVASNWLSGVALQVVQIVNYVLLGISVLLTIISGVNYMVKNKDVLKEDKKEAE